MRWSRKIEGFPKQMRHAAVAVGTQIFSIGGESNIYSSISDSPMDIFGLNLGEPEIRWKLIKPKLSAPLTSTLTPGQISSHIAVAYKNNVIILSSNEEKGKGLNSVCCFNTETLKWNELNVTGTLPEACCFYSAVAIQNEIIIFGGIDSSLKPLNDVHSLNMDNFVWSNITTIQGTPPTLCYGHSAAVYENRFIYIFGGEDDYDYWNDLICLDWNTKQWTRPETSGTIPQPRSFHYAFMHKGLMYIYGGQIEDNSFANDLFSYNPETCKWRKVKPIGKPPSPRLHCGCVVINDSFYVFGGTDNDKDALDGTFVLDLE